MAPDHLINPHVLIYFRASHEDAALSGDVQSVPTIQELRHEYDLGTYTTADILDLMEKLEDRLVNWVENHPPLP